MTAADWEFVSTGPNADPARNSTSEGGIFGGAGRTVRPSFSLGGSGSLSGSGDIDRAASEPANQQQSTAAIDKKMKQEEDEDTPGVLPGHARAWFSLPADGVLDSFLLLQYLRSVLCADGLMKILHCANEQQQRPAGAHSPPLPPPRSPEASSQRQQQQQQQRQLHQLNPPPKIDVSFKGTMGHRRRSTGTSPLAHAYSHGGLGGTSGAASVGGGRGGSSGAEGEQTSAAAAAVVAAAVDEAEAIVLAGTKDPRRHSGGSGRTNRRASTGRPITTGRHSNALEARGGSSESAHSGSTNAGDSEPSSSLVESINPTAQAEESNGEVATVAEAKASEQRSAADEPDRSGHVASGTEEGEDADRRSSKEGVQKEGEDVVASSGDKPAATTLEEKYWIEDVEIDQADLNFVYSWQPGVPRSDPAAKRTAAAARKVRA